MAGRLEGKVAIVTGAGSGMGAASAKLFCAEGAMVIAADVSGKQELTAAEAGPNCIPCRADVSQAGDVRAMIDLAISRFGKLNVIFNNAGVNGLLAPTADYDDDEFDRIVGINLKGVYYGMKYAIPEMLKQGGGSIINTASMAAIVAFPMMSAYCASKGGVTSITRLTAAEYAKQNIRVNAILPGAIATGMTDALPDEYMAGAIAATPMGRMGTPMEIATLALYLASDESSFITGTCTPVDGGYTTL